MATRARFGRLPRSAPSLTSTIVSLAQQYQGARDRNIETAWKSGGLFEGKKVTDSMFLSHWKKRLSEVSTDDPMWDYYNNLIHTYNFTIAESKMGQKYAEEKVSEREMAAFYRSWAAKLPKDSEAYRQLMTQAAKFKAASTARGHGSSARAAAAAYAKAQNATYNSQEAPFEVATSMIARYALEAGYIDRKDYDDPDFGWSKLTNAEGENDPANFSAMLTDLAADPTVAAGITAEIRKYDPSFSGTFNEQTMAALANNARNGAGVRLNRATRAGRKGDANDARGAADRYSLQSMVIRTSLGTKGQPAFVEQNEYHRSRMDAVLDPTSGASPMERHAAIEQYRDWLTGSGGDAFLRSLPPGSIDPLSPNWDQNAAGMLGALNNTVNALNGKPTGQTLKDDLFGFDTEEAGQSSDAVKLGTVTADNSFLLESVAAGTAITVRTDGKGKPQANGPAWEVFARDAPEVLGNDNLIPLAVPAHSAYRSADGSVVLGGANGEVRYQVAVPVKVRMNQFQDPATGAFTGVTKPYEGMDETVGKQMDIVVNGVTVPMYGTYVGGRLVWGTVNPFKENPTERITKDKDGTIVHNYSALVAPTATPPGGPKPPEARWNPQDQINFGALMSPSTSPNWNPATDKQTVWDSPQAGFAYASSEHMAFISSMGNNAIAQGEREWFSRQENWTPDMTQKYNAATAAGARPDVAMKTVVDTKSNELISSINFAREYGVTPEQQDATRGAFRQLAEARNAEKLGMTVAQMHAADRQTAEQGQRTILANQLADWGMGGSKARVFGGDLYTVTGVKTGGPAQAGGGLPKGWTANTLLTQPGMTMAQANDLAYRISKGAVGQPGAYPNTPIPGFMGGRTGMVQPGQNPFMPAATSVGPTYSGAGQQQLPGTPAQKPLYGPPNPNPTTINPYTGFVVPKTAPKPVPKTVTPDLSISQQMVKAPALKGYTVKEAGGDWGYQKKPGGPTIL